MQFSKNRIERSFLLRKEKGSSLKIKQNKDFPKYVLTKIVSWWQSLLRGLSSYPKELPFGRLPRKEVIQPQVLLRLPCYDFTPIADPTFGRWLHCWLPHGLRVLPTLMVWRAVCTRPGNVFTATCWFAITSNSGFMQASFSLQSELGWVLWDLLHLAVSRLFVLTIVARV